MPVDAVVYTTVLTLVIFLLFRIPFLWNGVNFDKDGDKTSHMAGGTAAILLGILTLTIQFMMASTHTWDGINYADAFNAAMSLTGSVLMVSGASYLLQLEKVDMTATSPQVR